MSEQEEVIPQKKKSRFDRSDLISIIALITSMAALGATIYEANILKDQQEIMQAQQKSSVWPYIDQGGDREWSEEDKTLTLTLSFINKGIGPALIKSVTPSFDGEHIDTSITNGLQKAISAKLPKGATFTILTFPTEGIIGVKEEKSWIRLKISNLIGPFDKLLSLPLSFNICYCSIYDDCWMRSGSEAPVAGGCGGE